MNARAFAIALIFLMPGLLKAQQALQDPRSLQDPYKSVQGKADYSSRPASSSASSERGMQEDIEVLRRILERKLKALYPAQTISPSPYPYYPGFWTPNTHYNIMSGGMGMQGAGAIGMIGMQGNVVYPNIGSYIPASSIYLPPTPSAPEPSLPLEGVYLKGQGVVYTVTLPSLHPAVKAKPVARKVSEWDSVRRQVLEEKNQPSKPSEEKVPELKDVLLRVLAENGHHFKHLGDNESLTIVITVRDNHHAPAPAANTPYESASATSAANTGKKEASSAHVQELELLGDLNLKRGHYGEAIAAFKKALELNPGVKQKASLHRKLAQAHLAQDQLDQAREELDLAAALLKKGPSTKMPPPAPRIPLALPTKLIVSAQKKLLLQAGEDKLTEEQFAAQAHVERIGPAR